MSKDASKDAEIAPVRAGEEQNWQALETYLRAQMELPSEPMQVQQFPRGHANLTYLIAFGAVQLVLRRPPFGKTAPGAHDMHREFRILSRLWQAYPRAPRAFAFCEDAAIIGAPFVVQEYRSGGVVIFGEPPAAMGSMPDLGLRLTTALANALADLHQVDYAAAGLSDFGQPDGYLQRQLAGWRERWRRAAPAASVREMDLLADRLERDVPTSTLSAIIHNDFKLDNCQFRADSPDTVVAVFDWDMATIGDPLVDVGIALDYWQYTRANTALGMPPKETFAALYAQRMGIDITALRWYEGFASWRTGIAVQQLYNRYAQGDSHDERMKSLAARVPVIAATALAALDA